MTMGPGPKTLMILALTCLLLLPYLCHTNTIPAHPNHVQGQLAFDFVKSIQGSKKGAKVKGIHKLKEYLHHFGYLDHKHLNPGSNDDHFDENLEAAIKTYQLNFNLKTTGTLDNETAESIGQPRCGVPDIIHGKTRMNAGKYSTKYAFFVGKPTWPTSQKLLSWAIEPGSRRDVIKPIQEYALVSWTGIAPFEYVFNDENVASADIKILFRKKGTYPTFDGPRGILAYAFAPTNGTLLFDSDENWAPDGPTAEQFDMGTVGLHELGHILGLQHSSDPDAIMWPITLIGNVKGLNQDDVAGIQVLYPS